MKRKWPDTVIDGLCNLKKNQCVLLKQINELTAQREFEKQIIAQIEADLQEAP